MGRLPTDVVSFESLCVLKKESFFFFGLFLSRVTQYGIRWVVNGSVSVREVSVTCFIQTCSTCGRKLEIQVEYIGLEVSCYHCRARFIAHENGTVSSCRKPLSVAVSETVSSIAPPASYMHSQSHEGAL